MIDEAAGFKTCDRDRICTRSPEELTALSIPGRRNGCTVGVRRDKGKKR